MISGEQVVTFLKEWFRGKGYLFMAGYGVGLDTLEATLYDPSTDMYHRYEATYEQAKAAGSGLLKDMTDALQASLDAQYNCKFICSVTQQACRCDENGCRQKKVARRT
jgi:hypothetical protein